MTTICAITGTLKDLTGNILANTAIDFVRTGIAAQDGVTVVPQVASATSNSAGILTISLFAGNYVAQTIVGSGAVASFSVAVPSTATAVLSDLIDAAPTTVTPQAVLDAQAAQTAAEMAATNSAASSASSSGYAINAAASASSAASVAQQDLSAFSDTMTYTPVDVVVGRMADWSDGGFNMRVIQPSLSWYNESTTAIGSWLGEATNEAAARLILGAGTDSYYHNRTDGKFYSLNATTGQTEVFRGHKAGFPDEYVVVAEAGRVIIFDATEPGQPMWMVFNGLGAFQGGANTSVALNNGLLTAGSIGWGSPMTDFLADTGDSQYNAAARVQNSGGIANRNVLSPVARAANPLVNSNVNDVAITVLPGAPINQTTGMPVPTIAVATDGGVSQIGWDGNGNPDAVWDMTGSGIFIDVGFTENNRLYAYQQSTKDFNISDILVADTTIGSAPNAYTYREVVVPSIYTTNTYVSDGQTYPTTSRSGIFYGRFEKDIGGAGIGILHENPATPTKGMVNYMTSTYLSGWMPGDIRGAWLADTTAETITGTELVTNGTFAADVSGWTTFGGATLSWGTGQATVTGVTATTVQGASQAISTVIGETYTVSIQGVGTLPPNRYVYIGNVLGSNNRASADNAAFVSGTNILTFVANATTTYVSFLVYTTGQVLTVDNVSVRLADPDRSVKNNGLQVFGALTKSPVAIGSDIVAYSGFSATNYLQQPYNPDLDFGTGDFCIMGWHKNSSPSPTRRFLELAAIGYSGAYIRMLTDAIGYHVIFYDGTTSVTLDSGSVVGNGFDMVTIGRRSGTVFMGINAGTEITGTIAGSITNTSSILRVGLDVLAVSPATSALLTLLRIGATAPSADQIKHIYETEKVLFQDNAKCTLYGTSDAVTDLAYDETLGTTGVLTSAGLSRFDGLVRTSYTAGSFSKVSMNNNLEVLI